LCEDLGSRFREDAVQLFEMAISEMNRREQWRKVLDLEVQRWQVMTCDQLVSALQDSQAYEVDFESNQYQVEVELLENTEQYVHVMVAVDDGSLPASISPATDSFICNKPSSG
jgi:hypothetical protein